MTFRFKSQMVVNNRKQNQRIKLIFNIKNANKNDDVVYVDSNLNKLLWNGRMKY